MSRKEELLNEKVFIAGGSFTQNVDAPNGVPHPLELEGLREEFFRMTSGYLYTELVDVEKTYPTKDETMDVKFKADFVVMRRKDFDELMLLDTDVEVENDTRE